MAAFWNRMHLYRGSPIVRSWSKYQRTIKDWSLCGAHDIGLQATEEAGAVSCGLCLLLIDSRPSRGPKNAIPAAWQDDGKVPW